MMLPTLGASSSRIPASAGTLSNAALSAQTAPASSPEFTFAPLLVVLLVPVAVLPFGMMLDKTAPANRGAATFDDSSLNAVMRPARCIVQVGHLLMCAVAFLACLGPAETSEALAPPSAMMSIWVRTQLPRVCGGSSRACSELTHPLPPPPFPRTQVWFALTGAAFVVSACATLIGSSVFSIGANGALLALHWCGSMVVSQWVIVGGGLATHDVLWWSLLCTSVPSVLIECAFFARIVLTNARWRHELCWPFASCCAGS